MLRKLAAIFVGVFVAITASGQVTQSRVLVTISGAVTDASKSTLTAFVDGQAATVQDLAPASREPLTFAILLDVSGSMKDKQLFEKQSALDLFRRLAGDRNIGFFGDFNDELYFKRKPVVVDDVIKELKEIGDFRGGTALRDSIVEAARVVGRSAIGTTNRRVVVVFSDGEDETSKLNLREAVASLQREGVPVFCVGLLGGTKSRQKSVAELQTLTEATGGISILLPQPGEFISTLFAEVEHQYWLTVASSAASDRKLHSLSVKSSDPTLRIAAPAAIAVHNER